MVTTGVTALNGFWETSSNASRTALLFALNQNLQPPLARCFLECVVVTLGLIGIRGGEGRNRLVEAPYLDSLRSRWILRSARGRAPASCRTSRRTAALQAIQTAQRQT